MEETIVFVETKEIKYIKSGLIVPKKLCNNSFIIAIKKELGVVSYIYFTVYTDYVHINYSFTSTPYRRLGYSTILRNYIIEFTKKNNIKMILSVPFEGANSMSILKRIGFIKNEKDDSFVLLV